MPEMRSLWGVLLCLAALDAVAWAAYRIDKACARRQWRRISERTLLILTVAGGFGAVIGMYGHRERHKTRKSGFVAVATLAAMLRLAVLGAGAYLRVRG
jgi:uncharacterized membrane protein YsdA (DUF1294 family)